MYLHSAQKQTILLVNYITSLAISQNANLSVHEKLTKLLLRTSKYIFRKGNFVRKKKMKNLREEFLQLFAETSPNKLSPLPK